MVANRLGIDDVRVFAGANVALVMVLLVVAAAILREQGVLKKMRERGELVDDAAP